MPNRGPGLADLQDRGHRAGDDPLGRATATTHRRPASDLHPRDTASPHWRGSLKLENRCFAECAPEPNPKPKKESVWFALAFASIWTTFNGDHETKPKPVPGPHYVYGSFTTAPNTVVEPIHPRRIAAPPSESRHMSSGRIGSTTPPNPLRRYESTSGGGEPRPFNRTTDWRRDARDGKPDGPLFGETIVFTGALQPHRVETFKLSTDPDFVAKVHGGPLRLAAGARHRLVCG